MCVYVRAKSFFNGSIGGAVEGWTFDVAFALMTVVLAMFANERRGLAVCGVVSTMRMSTSRARLYDGRLKERKWRLACWVGAIAVVAEGCRGSETFVMLSVLRAHWTHVTSPVEHLHGL